MRCAGALSLLLAESLMLMACTNDAPPASADEGDVAVATFTISSDLPKCVPSRLGEVYYVSSESKFYYCDGRQLEQLDAVGQPGANGVSFLAALTAAGPGDCSNGGVRILIGPDSDRDGALDAAEVAASSVVCNGDQGPAGPTGATGANGTDGANGGDGKASLVVQSREPPGAQCQSGGTRIDSGLDDDQDGQLAPDEIDATSYVCNGAPGTSSVCAAPLSMCQESSFVTCRDLGADPNNCGACGNVCTSPVGSIPICVAGRCELSCPVDRGDCNSNGADGCETDLLTNARNCGSCGLSCQVGESCSNGACITTVWEVQLALVNTSLRGVTGTVVDGVPNVIAVGDAGGGSGTIVRTSDGGGRWDREPGIAATSLYGVWGQFGGAVYAVGADGTILRWTGGAWLRLNSSVSTTLRAVGGTSNTNVFVVGDGGVVLHSVDGTNWTREDAGTTGSLLGIAAISAQAIWGVGGGGTVVHNTGSSSWLLGAAGTTATLTSVSGASSGIFAASANGTILGSGDGSNWLPMFSGPAALNGIWANAASGYYAVGVGGTIVASRDGVSWSPEISGTSNSLNAVWAGTTGDVYAVGDNGTILHQIAITP
jgi:hypothetical protein